MATIFKAIFNFLYYKYFLYIAFDLVYLLEKKIYIFIDSLKIVGFTSSRNRLRSLAKYKKKAII